MARRPNETVRLNWPEGLNNLNAGEETPAQSLREALNVDITRTGSVRRRPGYELVQGGNFRALWGDRSHGYAVADDTIYHVADAPELALTPIVTGLNSHNPVAFGDMAGVVFYTDGRVTGRLDGRQRKPWAVSRPMPPSLNVVDGGMPAGRYQVVLTGIDADEREGPASYSQLIELDSKAGIEVVMPTLATDLEAVAVYLTPCDGDVFYRQQLVARGTPSVRLINDRGSAPLRTQFKDGPPTGHIIRHHAGRLYVAEGSVLWYSEAFAPHLFDRAQNFVQFPGRINMVEPVADGIYVAADHTYFLQGTNPAEFQQLRLAHYGAVEGTAVQAEGQDFPDSGVTGPVVVWASDNGICLGAQGGQMQNLTRQRVDMPLSGSGAGLLRREKGQSQYVATGGEDTSGFEATDRAEARIIRNGVIID